MDGSNSAGSREELLASVRAMKRMDSRGRGELDIQKSMIRKYSKVKEEQTSIKHAEQKRDIIKFLTRKESKSKVLVKDERLKEYEDKHEINDYVDGNFRKCHVKDEKSSDEVTSEIIRCESDDLLLMKEVTPVDDENSTEVPSEIQVRSDSVDLQKNDFEEKHFNQDRKNSRFRLKDTFTKFDAKVRRAFSWETSTSLDGGGPNSEFYDDGRMIVVTNDGEVRESTLEDVLETEIDDAEDALDSIENHSSSESTITSIGGSPPTSTADSSSCHLDNTPKGSIDHTPEEEPITTTTEYDVTEERPGSGNRSSLLLFDEFGKPVPPPRRSLTVGEPKPPSRKNSDEKERTNSLTPGAPSGCSKSLNVSPNERRMSSKPAIGLNIVEAKSYGENCEMKNIEASSMPHTPSGAQVVAASACASSGITSPTSLGVFKSFMSNITKKGSSHALHGMYIDTLPAYYLTDCTWNLLFDLPLTLALPNHLHQLTPVLVIYLWYIRISRGDFIKPGVLLLVFAILHTNTSLVSY